MPKFEDNLSPYLTLVEQGSTPASPAAGNRKAYVRTSDHALVAVDSAGTVVALGGGGGSAGGSLVLLEQHVAAASASLDFTTFVSPGYDDYLIEFVGITGSTTGQQLSLRCSNGGVFDTGSNYIPSYFVWSNAGSALGGGSAATSLQIYPYAGRDLATGASIRVDGWLRFYRPADTTPYKNFMGELGFGDSVTAGVQRLQVNGQYIGTSAVDGLRFLVNTGTFSGTIRIYGVAKTSGSGGGTGPYEYDYAEVTGGGGAVALAGTSAATATTVVAGHAVTYDGATAVVIEVHAERWQKGTTFSILDLWEDSTNIARIATTTIADSGPVSTAFRRTPSAGSHTYTVKGYSDGGTGSVYAGAAGVDVSMPVFLRVTAATGHTTSLAHGYDSVATDQSTTSASYTDLATAGPSVTVTVNTKVKVTLSADMYGSVNGCICRMAVDMSGANTHAASDVDNLLYCNFDGSNNEHAASRVLYFSGLTPGSTTFKAQYKRSVGGTAHWLNRTILVECMD